MKKLLKILGVIGASLAVLGLAAILVFSWLNGGTVRYQVSARNLDPEALNSYPQRVEGATGSVYTITTHQGRTKKGPAPVSSQVPQEVAIYLEPSTKIQSDNPTITKIAAGIAPGETEAFTIAKAAAKWTAKNIKYDNPLSQEIWQGRSDTRSALDTLAEGKGTCSEYANVFIAIMRNKGIPARFVMGKMYFGSYHAWAEIWVDGQGWIPVETQGGKVGVSARHIKLFAGRDFVDINVPLQDIQVTVKRLGRQ